ncbi:hypothetical protein V6N11_067612 [Hibiscus sabdariffa]|uniref:Reverse transcriptase zinc-binding domain-containing protein n=1 Tax=Hibiscus sabdariffa TaxID=183260 RepID=A0ABR2SS41_9ROSI
MWLCLLADWKWYLFKHLLPRDILLHIAAIKGPLPSMDEASVGWKLSRSTFTLRSTYESCLGTSSAGLDKLWCAIHKFRGPQCIRIFLWLACMNKIMTN